MESRASCYACFSGPWVWVQVVINSVVYRLSEETSEGHENAHSWSVKKLQTERTVQQNLPI